jgi:hypothetical protein
MMKKLELSFECADAITLANLKQAKKYHKGELKKKKENPSYWIHPEDQVQYGEYIKALDLLIDYYGG